MGSEGASASGDADDCPGERRPGKATGVGALGAAAGRTAGVARAGAGVASEFALKPRRAEHKLQVQFVVFSGIEVPVRDDVRGKPVFLLKIFAINFEHVEGKAGAVLGGFGDEFAEGFHDGEIVIVHPDRALKIPTRPADLFRLHLKNVSVQVVELVLARV